MSYSFFGRDRYQRDDMVDSILKIAGRYWLCFLDFKPWLKMKRVKDLHRL